MNSRNELGTEGTSASRDKDNVEERSNISDRSYTGRLYKLAISCGEKGERSASSNKFEESTFLRALRALQNGKFKFTPVPPQEKRLNGQAGFEGCLLLRTSPQGISKICSISMGWKTLRVLLPLLQPGSCTTNIHEIVERASSSIEKVEYADHNPCRRHINNRSNQKGGGVNQGQPHLPLATLRVSSQFKEICASTMSGNRISGPYSKFRESDSLTPLTKGAEGPRGMHKDVQQELDIDFGTDQTFSPLFVNHPSSCISSFTNSESSTVTDTVSEIEEVVSN